MRGRKPDPTALKILKNNPGRRPFNPHEPKYEPLDRTVPEELTDPVAVKEWQRVIDVLSPGHMQKPDRATLMLYCLKYAQWIKLEREAATHPNIIKGQNNKPIANPLVQMANRAGAMILKTASELGITPSSRTRITVANPSAALGVDEFTAFQRRRKGA